MLQQRGKRGWIQFKLFLNTSQTETAAVRGKKETIAFVAKSDTILDPRTGGQQT